MSALQALPGRARMHPLPRCFPELWACAWGEDIFGLWQAFEVEGVRQVMRWIPPGVFEMGSPPDEEERGDDETLHEVTLTRGFWLADTACTQALWQVVTGQNPSRFGSDLQNPVENVSWSDVTDTFIPALAARVTGLSPVLPTEAQWEYACRAGTETPFYFGTHVDPSLINYDGNIPNAGQPKGSFRKRTVPVRELPANAWGLYQMHGNVWEWCADGHAPYSSGAVEDPVGNPESGGRVLRGGSWIHDARYCRSAYRYASVPGYRYDFIGFRLARGAS